MSEALRISREKALVLPSDSLPPLPWDSGSNLSSDSVSGRLEDYKVVKVCVRVRVGEAIKYIKNQIFIRRCQNRARSIMNESDHS